MDRNDLNYMPVAEFVSGGYLQEVNRQFLHPLGLTLEVERQVNADTGEETYKLVGIIDGRQDPEGFVFDDSIDLNPSAEKIHSEWLDAEAHRMLRLGYVIQPCNVNDPLE